MRKYFLIILFNLSCLISIGQAVVDYNEIEKNIKDEASELYYPRLLGQFVSGDSNMTIEQKRHCYYGYLFQDNYSPYTRPKGTDQVDTLLLNSSTIDTVLIQKILDSTITAFPFDYKTVVYSIRFSSSVNEILGLKTRLDIIFDAIKSSGNGSKKTPFEVILLPHELLMMNKLNLVRDGKQFLTKNDLDVFELAKNDKKIKKVYFDVSRLKPTEPIENILFHHYYQVYIYRHKLDFELK